MAKRTENILDLLSQCPWWVSVVLSGIVYIALGFIVPMIEFKGSLLKGLADAAPSLAVPLGIAFIIPAPIAFFNSLRKKNYWISRETSIQSNVYLGRNLRS